MSENSYKDIVLLVELGEDADAEETDMVTTQLLTDLGDLEIERASKVRSDEVVEGTRSGDPVTIGAIALAIMSGTVPALIAFLNSWLERRKRDEITIKITRGDNALELTYNPKTSSPADMEARVRHFQQLLGD